MPTAGEEGYEKLIVCPYDRAHEIRKGRMQFHLEKCRRNFPTTQLVDCLYNKGHLVPKEELEWHMQEECESRATWDRFVVEEPVECPVKDLVPVNAATVDDGGENWDTYEASGSVLQHIKAEAENKPIFRMCQVASKATRKAFRKQERLRFSQVAENQRTHPNEKPFSDTSSIVSNNQPLPKPRLQPNVPVIKQDPTKAIAAINKQFRTLDINMKTPTGDVAPSETSSMINGPPSEFDAASTSRQMPFSYAAASRAAANRPPSVPGAGTSGMTVLTSQRATTSQPTNRSTSAMSDVSMGSSASMMSALSQQQQGNSSRPTTALSNSTMNSYATAPYGGPANRPPSAMSDSSMGSSMIATNAHRPPNSTTCRPTTAMNLEASFKRAPLTDEEGFCQIPIPGLGRGRRRPVQ